MKKAFDEGWGAVIAKTISVDSSKVHLGWCFRSCSYTNQCRHAMKLLSAIVMLRKTSVRAGICECVISEQYMHANHELVAEKQTGALCYALKMVS